MVERYIQLRPRGLWGEKHIHFSFHSPFQAYPGTNQKYWWQFCKQEVQFLLYDPEEEENFNIRKEQILYMFVYISTNENILFQNSVGFCLSNPCISTISRESMHLHIEGFNQGK